MRTDSGYVVMDVHAPSLLKHFERAKAEFKRWGWKPSLGPMADELVIYIRRKGKKDHTKVVLGKGSRWSCQLCEDEPHRPRLSYHWQNWGRVPLHMIMCHGAKY